MKLNLGDKIKIGLANPTAEVVGISSDGYIDRRTA